MDKYTVDLDKVLNDFEYSEYSLENAKLNRSVHEEVANTSFNQSLSRNDTAVKHSMNNVFHSLNEYLSTDITPKTVQSSTRAPKNINMYPTTLFTNNQNFVPTVSEFHNVSCKENVQETSKYSIRDSDCDNGKPIFDIDDLSTNLEVNDITEIKTDNLLDTEPSVLLEIQESGSGLSQDLKVSSERTEDSSGNVEVASNEEIEFKHEISEDVLVDLGDDEGDKVASQSQLIEICDNSNDGCTVESEDRESIICPNVEIEEQETVLIEEPDIVQMEEKEIMKVEDPVIVKVGFEKDVDLDEDNLDQYFQELEEEFEKEEKAEAIDPVVPDEELPTEARVAEIESISNVLVEHLTELQESQLNINTADVEKNDEKVSGETVKSEMEDHVSSEQFEDPKEGEENVVKDEEKNSRPQSLMLVEESQEKPRKIDLVGDPGSTPYNNVFSSKDFEKVVEAGGGDKLAARPGSPTYSDVSTNSISSSTSGSAGYDDAVTGANPEEEKTTEVNTEHQETVTQETIPNNMVSSGETSKSDVTIDKDFKNNLKDKEETEESATNLVKKDNEERVEITVAGASEASTSNETEDSVNVEAFSAERLEESSSSLGIDWLGKQAPLWIPDNEAMSCLHCDMKFTVIKRRHHCRACGLVLCSKCCNLKYRLEYLDAEARVCKKCYDILNKDTNSSSDSDISQESSSPSKNLNALRESPSLGQPNPNNPLEYCSTVSPLEQVDPGAVATPSVMVPVGVLKRKGSNKGRSNKSVMFCDGIRPGSDLTNLDTDFNYSDSQKADKSRKTERKIGKNQDMLDLETRSFIPSEEDSLPPTVTIFKSDVKYLSCANNGSVVEMLRNESLTFALQTNLFVRLKIIDMACCVKRTAWCFSTEGMMSVGQDEIVILLEVKEGEQTVPKEVFVHLNNIYLEAVKGSSVKELGLSLHPTSPFLGSKNHAGFVYIKHSFQCTNLVEVPSEPYLFGILIHRWETPWAKLFPLRLVLRLGAEYKYYPSPIISTRDRDSVFVEVGHTIINLLADFRNYTYTLPQIRGLLIHMQERNTTVIIPSNRYDQVIRGLSNSSDHILAFAGNFSVAADSHLVCIQDTESATNGYSTHAINICNQPRNVTGASFIVFNGALKSTSGLTAKSNIVEDGLMIQILPEHMLQLREALRNKKDHTIQCGCMNEESDETVTIVWGEPDTSFNMGVSSAVDKRVMKGVPSIRVHNGRDYICNSGSRLIRWTEVFIMEGGEEHSRNQDPVDISKIAESIAKATCQALVMYLDLLVSNSFYKIGIRANLHVDNVSYSAGSNGVKLPPIYMKSLDNELIPVLHRITSNNSTEQPIMLELIFRILNV